MSEKTLAKMVVKLEAEVKSLHKDLETSNKKLQKFSKKAKNSLSGVKVAFAGLGVATGLFAKKVADATIKQEAAVAQLEATWKSTGGAVGLTVDQMIKDAGKLQGVSIFGDEEIIKAQSQLSTFINITGEEFRLTTQAALDMSTKLDQDLKSSVIQLGKALNDPIKGISALSKVGVSFTQEQKDLIQGFIETNDLASAQRVILKELNVEFGGSALAARQTFGGALKGVSNAFGDLLEADSMGGAIEGLNELEKLLADPQTIAAAGTLANAIIDAFGLVAKAVTGTVNVVKFLGEELAAAIHGPALDDVVRRTERIAELTEKIAINTERAKKAGHAGRQARDRLPELEKELETLKKQQEVYESLNRNSARVESPEFEGYKIGDGKKAEESSSGLAPEVDNYGYGEGAAAFSMGAEIDAEVERASQIKAIRDGWREQEEQAELLHLAKIEDFKAKSTKDKVKTFLAEGVAMTQGAANANKKLFKLNKALALADAAATLPSAVIKAFNAGNGLPFGAGFAAMTLASGLARIKEIKKSKFGGGTSPSLAGTGGGAVPVTNVDTNIADVSQLTQTGGQQQTQNPSATYIFNGDIFAEGAEEQIIDMLIRANDNQRFRAVDRNGEIIFER